MNIQFPMKLDSEANIVWVNVSNSIYGKTGCNISDYFSNITTSIDLKLYLHTVECLLSRNFKIEKFIINSTQELILWDKFYGIATEIVKVFKKYKKEDKLVFLDNGIGQSFHSLDGVNYMGLPFLLGDTRFTNNDDIKARKFKYNFMYLNRVDKPHRLNLLKYIIESNIDSKVLYSYSIDNSSHPYYKSIDTSVYNNWEIANTPYSDIFLNCFIDIVSETSHSIGNTKIVVSKNSPNNFTLPSDRIHITEKTSKAISSGHPFIINGQYNSLKKLKELGFKTFSDFWDESYDSESDYSVRFKKITKLIEKLSKLSLIECENMYNSMIPILKYNQSNLNKIQDDIKYFEATQFLDIKDTIIQK